MSYQRYRQANFGAAYGGLATVGYRLYNSDGTPNGSRSTAGVVAQGTATGSYGATVTHPAAFTGAILPFELAKQLSRRALVSFVGGFCGGKVTQQMSLSPGGDLRIPAVALQIDPAIPRCVIAVLRAIAGVFRRGCQPQIIPAIVQMVSVAVIRPFSRLQRTTQDALQNDPVQPDTSIGLLWANTPFCIAFGSTDRPTKGGKILIFGADQTRQAPAQGEYQIRWGTFGDGPGGAPVRIMPAHITKGLPFNPPMLGAIIGGYSSGLTATALTQMGRIRGLCYTVHAEGSNQLEAMLRAA